MALYVQKFGGSSLATTDLIHRVAEKVKRYRQQGHQLVIVVSAMQGDTDHLVSLAKSHCKSMVNPRELASLVSIGEQKCAALLAMALHSLGFSAKSLNAHQAGIFVDGPPGSASITRIEVEHIQSLLMVGTIPVVTGFQGMGVSGDVYTMGRGGSDLTAVALSHWLRADECQVYTDVNGVYTVDPNVVSSAEIVSCLSYFEMLELSRHGAKVLQYQAVQLAARYSVPVRVMHAHGDDAVSTVIKASVSNDLVSITSLGLDRNQVKIEIIAEQQYQNEMTELAQILRCADFSIDMYMLHQNHGIIAIKFTTHVDQFDCAWSCVHNFAVNNNGLKASYNRDCGKISLIGFGMSRQAHLSSFVLELLGENNIETGLLSSFCHRLSLVVAADNLERAAQILYHHCIKLRHPQTQ